MLQSLRIRNLALLEEVELDFEPGFTAVTGETGAGKSILLGALSLLSMFEYFIGNTDWSISGLHNIALMQDSSARVIPVAFDFDWTGAVDARYAFPDKQLKIRSVTDRLYRGNCMTPAQLKTVLDRFRAKRPAMDAVFAQLPQLAPDRAKRMKSYFDDFWKRIDDPRGLQREIADDCQKSGN